MGTTSKLEAATSMLVFHKINILIVTSTAIHLNHHNDKYIQAADCDLLGVISCTEVTGKLSVSSFITEESNGRETEVQTLV